RHPRRADGQLRRLPVPEDVAGLQHAPDDGDPVVASLRAEAGGEGVSHVYAALLSPALAPPLIPLPRPSPGELGEGDWPRRLRFPYAPFTGRRCPKGG